ncbi:MAG: hypothetical protein U5Q44_06435 [Dehalococcoidia bacterium]|nr:hypothetical protein [Dehalococcoidia bacterium]
MKSQMEMQAQRAQMTFDWDSLVKAGYVVAGSPSDVAEQLDKLTDDLRVGHLMCGLHMGNMPRDKVFYNTKMFAEKVAPQLRDKFNDWDDHWYPNPMQADQRSRPSVPSPDEVTRPALGEPVSVGGGGASGGGAS